MARVDPQVIRQGLIQRGLPPHVADGFVMNMRDESGLNPGINEIAPLVPGSRGGFGLYQLTGPRRRAYEQYASQRGVDVADPNAQLDFLMMELQGPEKRAAQSIFSAPDANAAAVAIARDFLRPAPENLRKRVAQYAGGLLAPTETVSTQGRMAEQGEPMAEERGLLGGLLNPDRRDRLIMALEGMTLNPNQALIQASGEAIKGRAAGRQESQAANRTAAWLRSQGREDLAAAVESGAVSGRDAASAALKPAEAKGQVVSAEQLRQMMPGAQIEDGLYNLKPDGTVSKVGGGGPTINIGGDGAPELGKLATDYGYVTDPVTRQPVIDPETRLPIAAPIPGSATARELEAAAAKSSESGRQSELKMGTTLENINLNIQEIENGGLPVTGLVGSTLSNVPGTAAADFRNRTTQINTRAALDEVQNMRDNSPTGGAVGQLTDSEREAIGLAATSLANTSSGPEYLRAAKNFRETMLNSAYGEGNWTLLPDGRVMLGDNGAPAGGGEAKRMRFNPETGQLEAVK